MPAGRFRADQACTLYDCFLNIVLEKQARDSKSRKANQLKTVIESKHLKIKDTTSLVLMVLGGGRSWIRTSEGVSQQIYSLPPLATWVSYHCQPLAGTAI